MTPEHPKRAFGPEHPFRERFYTNMSTGGMDRPEGTSVTLENYLDELREQFANVRVLETATDINGKILPNHVAIFVTGKRKS